MKAINKNITRKLTFAGVLIAVGVLLPQVFHIFGGSATGSILLPMHIPVLIAGLLLGWPFGAAAGFIIPIISFLLTGMPPMVRLPFMIIELISYGIFSGLFSIVKINIYFKLIFTMIIGRIIYGAFILFASNILGLDIPPAATVWTSLVTGIPGIIVQLVLLPLIVNTLKKVIRFDERIDSGKGVLIK